MSDDIVISGISGRFAESDNMDELWHNLINNIDMVTDNKTHAQLFDLPLRRGKIKSLHKFDAQYFDFSDEHANLQDPLMRVLHEVVFEAIVDSGNSPENMRGKNVGVFVANDDIERNHLMVKNENNARIHSLNGTYRPLLANNISFWFDFKGPSITISTGCSGGGSALNQALVNIKQGMCDSAIVAGCHTSLNPVYSLTAKLRRFLSADGKSKFMDESANGYPRSEICCALYVERKAIAKRIYATIVGSLLSHDGHREKRYAPSRSAVSAAIDDTIKRANIDKTSINYVECHGAGTKLGDLAEIGAIVNSLCGSNRSTPILLGSVKSNLGHAEAGATISSIAKVILSFENDTIPANLHLQKVAPEFENYIHKNVIEHINSNLPCTTGPALVISFGYGGSNAFTLLEKNNIVGGSELDNESILIPLFARNEQGIVKQIDKIKSYKKEGKITLDFLTLYYEISNLKNMPYRGYLIFDQDDTFKTANHHSSYKLIPQSKKKLVLKIYDIETSKPDIDKSDLAYLLELADELQLFSAKINYCLSEIIYNIDEYNSISKNIISHIIIIRLLLTMGLTPNHCMANTFIGQLLIAFINGDITDRHMISIAIEMSKIDFENNLGDFDYSKWIKSCFVQEHWAQKFIDSYLGVTDKTEYSKDTIFIEFSRKSSNDFEDNENVFILDIYEYINILTVLGHLYCCGFDIDWSRLYATRGHFPVSRGTQSIAPLIQWDHSVDYYVPQYHEFL